MMAPFRKRTCPLPVGLDRYVVVQNGPQAKTIARLARMEVGVHCLPWVVWI
jgi:hypothetical protein